MRFVGFVGFMGLMYLFPGRPAGGMLFGVSGLLLLLLLLCICIPTPGRGLPYGSGLGLSRCLGPGECLHSFIHGVYGVCGVYS